MNCGLSGGDCTARLPRTGCLDGMRAAERLNISRISTGRGFATKRDQNLVM